MACFEFLPMEDDNADATASQQQLVELAGMEAGREYELEVSNYAGFRRYRISDVLRVTGFHNVAPQFRYVCRRNVVLSVGVKKTGEAELQRVGATPANGCTAPSCWTSPRRRAERAEDGAPHARTACGGGGGAATGRPPRSRRRQNLLISPSSPVSTSNSPILRMASMNFAAHCA
nr:unnamed protein product [Digitaria exilis]